MKTQKSKVKSSLPAKGGVPRIASLKWQDCNSKIKISRFKKGRRQIVVSEPGEYVVELAGKGAEVEVLGLLVGKGKARVEVKVTVKHRAPKTRAKVMIYGLVGQRARMLLQGLLKIEKKVWQAESNLVEKALILGEGAEAEAVPSLEIETDEVKASHAASVGKIDQAQVFYLVSRGLERVEAEKMIVEGFFEPVLERIRDGEKREQLRGKLERVMEEVII